MALEGSWGQIKSSMDGAKRNGNNRGVGEEGKGRTRERRKRAQPGMKSAVEKKAPKEEARGPGCEWAKATLRHDNQDEREGRGWQDKRRKRRRKAAASGLASGRLEEEVRCTRATGGL